MVSTLPVCRQLNLCQAMARGNANIDIDQFLQKNYYPALESLAFLIIQHHIPAIDCKEYFFVAGGDHTIVDYFSRYFDKDFLTKYQISDALVLLHQIKPINLKLNKAIKVIHQHLNLEAKNNYCKIKFNMTPYNLFLFPPTAQRNKSSEASSTKENHLSMIQKQPH